MYTYKCNILEVIDGDTIDIELDLGFEIRLKERVRLLGIDTPEVFGTKATVAGQQASNFTKQWVDSKKIQSGHFVYESKKYNAKDKYGRSLGIISWIDAATLAKETINTQLVEKGHATLL